MKKSTILLVGIVAALLTLVVAMAIEPSRIAILNFLQTSVFNPLYLVGVSINTWLGTFPALWTLGAGTLVGLLLASIIKYRAFFKRHTPSIKSPSPSPSLGSSPSLSQTPSGATIRPSIEEKVDIKEVVAKVKEELKEEPTPA